MVISLYEYYLPLLSLLADINNPDSPEGLARLRY